MNFRDGAFFEKVELDDGKVIGFSHDKVRFEREGDFIYVSPKSQSRTLHRSRNCLPDHAATT